MTGPTKNPGDGKAERKTEAAIPDTASPPAGSERRDPHEAGRLDDLAGADDHEAGAEEIVGPEEETRELPDGEPSAAQKVKDAFPKP